MTTVHPPKCLVMFGVRAFGRMHLVALMVCLFSATFVVAQDNSKHWLHAGALPPGAIGSQRLVGGGQLSCYIQPVEILAPKGTEIAFVSGGAFGMSEKAPRVAGLQISRVYRMRVSRIPGYPGMELYPTVELLDRLHPPPGQALRFPIPVELTKEELVRAAQGQFITRVIYVENPDEAIPVAQEGDRQNWFEAAAGEDPLVVADRLGRPVAILRIGGRIPSSQEVTSPEFLFGSPNVVLYPKELTGHIPFAPPVVPALPGEIQPSGSSTAPGAMILRPAGIPVSTIQTPRIQISPEFSAQPIRIAPTQVQAKSASLNSQPAIIINDRARDVSGETLQRETAKRQLEQPNSNRVQTSDYIEIVGE